MSERTASVLRSDRGVAQSVARRAHNPEAVGSNPTSATSFATGGPAESKCGIAASGPGEREQRRDVAAQPYTPLPGPSRGLGGTVLALALLAGCPAPVPPPVFAVPLAEAPSPPATPAEILALDYAPPADLLDGDAAPFAGVLLSPREYALRRRDDETLIPWWETRVSVERMARDADRTIAEARAQADAATARELRQDVRALRWAGLGLGALGLVTGFGLGWAAGVLP